MSTPEERSKRGKNARNRGKRVEYSLRDYLRSLNYYDSVHRVPLSGSSQGFKGDVVAEKNGVKTKFESKAHAGKYKSLFELVEHFTNRNKTHVLSTYLPAPAHRGCDMAFDIRDFGALGSPNQVVYELPGNLNVDQKKFKRALGRLPKLIELLDGSDVLVLYENRKPFLFVRFR